MTCLMFQRATSDRRPFHVAARYLGSQLAFRVRDFWHQRKRLSDASAKFAIPHCVGPGSVSKLNRVVNKA
ncbi:MAG: hypothetical protein QOG17_3470 [Gammaproteobacteria bacterium]|nr:hypothetical protein [Gammaproteobacteria bacterium]